jgi:hypothetical protein
MASPQVIKIRPIIMPTSSAIIQVGRSSTKRQNGSMDDHGDDGGSMPMLCNVSCNGSPRTTVSGHAPVFIRVST